jgi:hypothetical protein
MYGRPKRNVALKKNLIGSVFFVGCGVIGIVGNIFLNEYTGNKPLETYLLHEVAGRNAIEKAYAAEKETLAKVINDKTYVVNKLDDQNRSLTDLISRGNERKTKPILDYSKLSAPRYIVELMERKSAQHGFPSIATVYCIAAYESRFDPTAHTVTSREDSRGLLQVNIKDAAHKKRNANPTKLFDPAYNLDYQLPELKYHYVLGQNKGLSGADLICYVSRYGQRPTWKEWIAESIRKSYKEYQNAVIKEG